MDRKTNVAQRISLLALLYFGIFSHALAQQEAAVTVAVFGISPTLTGVDLKETSQTRDLVEWALSKRTDLVVRKLSPKKAVYPSLKDLINLQEAEGAKLGMVLVVSRKQIEEQDLIVFNALGGPSFTKAENFAVQTANLDAAFQRITWLASGYGHIVFDVTTVPPGTDIYVGDQPFKTTDEKGRFKQTYTWPAGQYKITFIAWVRGRQKEQDDRARVNPKEWVVFKRAINLEK